MVDRALIKRKLTLLQERKLLLQSYRLRCYADFLKGPNQKAVEKVLQEMVELCIDIGKHIIADEGFPIANDSREIFQTLHAKKIISQTLMKIMHDMVGFRNFIVHLYERIDPEVVYNIYHRHLRDFDRFARAIQKLIL